MISKPTIEVSIHDRFYGTIALSINFNREFNDLFSCYLFLWLPLFLCDSLLHTYTNTESAAQAMIVHS